jgi:hypothetical protein
MADGRVGVVLRQEKHAIAARWAQSVVADVQELANLDRGLRVEHVSEVLDGLADWLEGKHRVRRGGIVAIAEGHALQRLAFGLDVAAINNEYATLRHVILETMLKVQTTPYSAKTSSNSMKGSACSAMPGGPLVTAAMASEVLLESARR